MTRIAGICAAACAAVAGSAGAVGMRRRERRGRRRPDAADRGRRRDRRLSVCAYGAGYASHAGARDRLYAAIDTARDRAYVSALANVYVRDGASALTSGTALPAPSFARAMDA